jgi:hypothetical protein
MQPGDTVICRNPHGYTFTEGKEYTVISYQPECPDEDLANFTWPAYVEVINDAGRKVLCHASRFIPKE